MDADGGSLCYLPIGCSHSCWVSRRHICMLNLKIEFFSSFLGLWLTLHRDHGANAISFLQDQHNQAIWSGCTLDWAATVFVPEYHYLMAEMKQAHLGFVGDSPCFPKTTRHVQECLFDTDLTVLLRRIPLSVAVHTWHYLLIFIFKCNTSAHRGDS